MDHGRRSLTLKPRDPLAPGVVYRVTLEPTVSDMFGNRMQDPFELVFSTGAEPVPTTLAGEVWDRVTGRGVADATVHAVGPGELVHQAKASQEGIYAFRYLPGGAFQVTAFEDVDRDGEVGENETRGLVAAAVEPGDTLFVDLPILAPDTLPARVTSAEALDSVTVLVTFDDFLDPEEDPEEWYVVVSPPEVAGPPIERVYQEAAYGAYLEAVADSFARLDSIAAEEAAALAEIARAEAAAAAADSAAVVDSVPGVGADSAAVAVDTVAAGQPQQEAAPPPSQDPETPAEAPAAEPEQEEPARRRGPVTVPAPRGARPGPMEGTDRVIPGRRLVIVLEEPLAYDIEYSVVVDGAVNINRLAEGGGNTTFVFEEPPPPEPDSAAVTDTLGVATDTVGGAAATDTLGAATDTLGAATDTIRPATGGIEPTVYPPSAIRRRPRATPIPG